MSFAKNLDAQMKAKGLSAAAVAAATGKTTAAVYQWRTGATKMPRDVDSIAKAVGCSKDTLLNGKKAAAAKPKAKAAAAAPKKAAKAASPRKVARKPVAAKATRRRSVER